MPRLLRLPGTQTRKYRTLRACEGPAPPSSPRFFGQTYRPRMFSAAKSTKPSEKERALQLRHTICQRRGRARSECERLWRPFLSKAGRRAHALLSFSQERRSSQSRPTLGAETPAGFTVAYNAPTHPKQNRYLVTIAALAPTSARKHTHARIPLLQGREPANKQAEPSHAPRPKASSSPPSIPPSLLDWQALPTTVAEQSNELFCSCCFSAPVYFLPRHFSAREEQ